MQYITQIICVLHQSTLQLLGTPHLRKKFALKVCLKSWTANYQELLEQSSLPTLKARRQAAKHSHQYKIINKVTFLSNATTQARQLNYSNRSVHAKALIALQAHSSQYLHSVFPITITAWNSLPPDAASARSISSFKTALKHCFVFGCVLVLVIIVNSFNPAYCRNLKKKKKTE